MSHKIEKPMSETTIKDQPEKEKRHREDSPTPVDSHESAKRRELSPPEHVVGSNHSNIVAEAEAKSPSSESVSADKQENKIAEEVSGSIQKTSVAVKDTPKKLGFGQAKGFAGLSGAASGFGNTSSTSTFSSLFSKGGQESAFSTLLNSAPSSSIFSQETAPDTAEKDKNDLDNEDENTHEEFEQTQDDEQYVVVKGLEKTAVLTGEEEETCIHLIRAKLYAIDPRNTEAGWKERGVGNLRVLRDGKRRTRLVMRADAVLRVILNLPLHPKYKLEDGGASMGEKTLRLFGVEDGTGIWLAIRVGNQKAAQELKQVIQTGMDETPIMAELPDGKGDTKSDAPIEEKVSGIVPHTSDNEAKLPLDSVEKTEVTNEKAILDEKAKSETVNLASAS